MRKVEEGPIVHFLFWVSKHLTKRRICSEELHIAGRQHHAKRPLLKDFSETLFALAKRLFRTLALSKKLGIGNGSGDLVPYAFRKLQITICIRIGFF
jgi:hypothetical protein